MKKLILIFIIIFFAGNIPAEIPRKYIIEGIKNNLALKQQKFSLKKASESLKEAKGKFLPSISIEARYSRAGGGRVIEFPIGDIVNPIYSTLNQLLEMNGHPPPFNTVINNEAIPFLREKEHDTKIRVVQPIFNPSLSANYAINRDMLGSKKHAITRFKQNLIKEIKVGYYNYLLCMRVHEIFKNTRKVVGELYKLSRILFENGKTTEEVVFRAEAESSSIESEIVKAEKDMIMARSYFNFLLNLPLDSPIEISENIKIPSGLIKDISFYRETALSNRPEIKQLEMGINAARGLKKLGTAAFLPSVTGVFDYGFQGEKYTFGKDEDYWMASVVLSWNIFNGGQDKAKLKKSIHELNKLKTAGEELKNKILLDITDTYYQLQSALKEHELRRHQLKSKKKEYNIVSIKYSEGMVPQIEHIQSMNDLTTAEIRHAISLYEIYKRKSYLELASASGQIQEK